MTGQRPLRILVPGPAFEDSFADNVRHTLVEMGHEVVALPVQSHAAYWSMPRYAMRVLRERLFGDRPSKEERNLLSLAAGRPIDAVLCLTWDLHPETLERLGRICPGRRILWWGDTPANARRWGLVNPGWDLVFLKDPAALRRLQLVGVNAHLLHEAMNPTWHRPLASQSNDHVVVAGNAYAYRQAILSRLHTSGVSIDLYGPRPPAWSAKETWKLWQGRYVVREEKSRLFGEAAACLNTFQLSESSSLNCRAFEIAGAGGLQVIEQRPVVSECFEPGREVLVFSTFDELLAHIDRARRFPSEVVKIRERAAARALAEHTYRHRLERILEAISG